MIETTNREVDVAQSHLIERPRLTRLLDESDAQILMLSAPAGYGKTTLARQWLRDKQHAWVQITPASADVVALTGSVAAAAEELAPGSIGPIEDYLRTLANRDADVTVLYRLLEDALAVVPETAIVAVDDHHLLTGSGDAEALFSGLVESPRPRVLVTTRERPGWATPRRIVYGEILELDREALAFDDAEAASMLAGKDAALITSFKDMASGWPAVLGMASLAAHAQPRTGYFGERLYAFLAAEVWAGIEASLREVLTRLAPAPVLSDDLVKALGGDRADETLATASRIGLLSYGSPARSHPLLREFLLRRLQEKGPEAYRSAVDAIARHYIRARAWDEAFEVVQQSDDSAPFDLLLEESAATLFASGRSSTLRRWLDGLREDWISGRATVIRADLALRDGEHTRAIALAIDAANALESTELHSRAWALASRAAYLSDRLNEGLEFAEAALRFATTRGDRRAALRLKFNVEIELETDELYQTLADLEALGAQDVDERLQLLGARAFLECRMGSLGRATQLAQEGVQLVPLSTDPYIRSGFLNTASYAYVTAAQYRKALEIIEEEVEDAHRYGLTFVLRHAYTTRAQAEAGIGSLRSASRSLELAMSIGAPDPHHVANTKAVASRLAIAQRRFDQAAFEIYPALEQVSVSLRAEIFATTALARVGCGDLVQGRALAEAALSMSRSAEPRILAHSALAAAQLSESDTGADAVADLADELLRTHALDGLLCAIRAFPELAGAVASAGAHVRKLVETLLEEAGERKLARKANVSLPGPSTLLTPRELEVLELVARGYSNDNIAKELFISVATVKVHIRHIFEKLDVTSRTQAALRLQDRSSQ